MMYRQLGHPRIQATAQSRADLGRVVWSPAKSIWITTMYLLSLLALLEYRDACAIIFACLFTLFTLCFGHSLGMHRLLIHRSFTAPRWLEYWLVHLGVIVGIAGPIGMMRAHDERDWAQRQPRCHAFFGQQSHWWRDWFWQLHCQFKSDHFPSFTAEPSVNTDRCYHLMQLTWMLQQLPWAILFYFCGGISWVLWGIAVRISLSVTGHWLIGYFAHRQGEQHWLIPGAAVQGFNLPWLGWICMGENWHNNHHAYPGSAQLGLKAGESDPGWCVLKRLESLGLVKQLVTPDLITSRNDLQRIG